MTILFKKASEIPASQITPPELFRERRKILRAALAAGAATASGGLLSSSVLAAEAQRGQPLAGVKPGPFGTDEAQTPYDQATQYNNFYELGTDKGDPVENAHRLKTEPWSVVVDGECAKPGKYALEDVLKPHGLEERIYRLRCVEAWSMVIPWVGIPLGDVLKRFEPNSRAKYVAFETLYDPENLPGQRRRILDWPYVEGLRIDEAMHPLAIFGVGAYGEEMLNQMGAPLRLVVPWKYGFKSIKSIVRISFTEQEPPTSWNRSAPHEYGFYANVNPDVSHPRWSQAKERRLDGALSGIAALFAPKIDTLPFNGYGEQVASLYSGMDLRKQF
jgi:sulfoxide reductase catalytic subunit YedY